MRHARRIQATACTALMVVLWGAPGAAQTVQRDVSYAADPHPEQHLDLHWPDGTARAVVLFVHGGSLGEAGERRSSPRYADVCQPFVTSGIACATTDYRLFPSFRWPTMALDVAAAVGEVRERWTARGGAADGVFLFGHSSGCHLVASLGTNAEYLASVGLAPSDLAGIVPMGCTLDRYDTALRGLDANDIREDFQQSDELDLYGTAEQWISANPAHHLGSHVPPTLVVVAHQERFFPSILEQGARFIRLLKEADVPAELVIVPGSHRSSIEDLDESGDPTFEAIRRFILAETRPGDQSRRPPRP